jgi:hypothetical protein
MKDERTELKPFLLCIVIAALVGPVVPAPLVQNGGFETGDLSNWAYDGNFEISPDDANAGLYSAQLGSTGVSTLQQNLAVSAGGTYELSFSVAQFGEGANSLFVSFDGQAVDSVVNAGAFGYTDVRIANLTAASASAPLAFALSGGNWAIDNVKLTRMDQLLENGSFESGDYTGWQRSSPSANSPHTNFVVDGQYAARLGTKGQTNAPRGSLTQNIETEAGREYEVSFWLRSPGLSFKEFTAAFGGQTVFDYVRARKDFGYTRISGTFEAAGGLTELSFYEKNQASWYLDDVRVSLVAGPDIRLAEAIAAAPKLTPDPSSSPVAETPEPQPLLLVGGGLSVLGAVQRRRRRNLM